MRIALLHPYSWPEVRRGGERYAHELAGWLAANGHDVDYVTGGDAASVETVDGVRMVRRRRRRMKPMLARGYTPLDTFGVTAAPWLLRHRYDVVHALVPAAAVAAAALRHRVVFTAIGHPGPLAEAGRGQALRLFRRAAKAAAVTTALSASAASAGERLAGQPVRVVSPGVRLDHFRLDPGPRRPPPRLLFTADAGDPRKRLHVLLAAMPEVLDALPDARLVMAGPGLLPDGLDPRVRGAVDVPGVGELADVADLYRHATVTVLPSVDEAFGLVVVESLACGTPVVGVASGSLPEIITPAVGGLAPPDQPGELAAAIIETVAMAADPATPQRCALHASQWSWDVVGPRHVAAYEAALRP